MESDSLRFTLNDRELKVFKSCLTVLYKIGNNLMISADSSKVRFTHGDNDISYTVAILKYCPVLCSRSESVLVTQTDLPF